MSSSNESFAASFGVTFSEIQAAESFLAHHLVPSPLVRNAWLSDHYGCDVYLKLENLHPIGSFKIRGATYRISKLSEDEKKRGVIAASAGNHAQGVAWGSKKLGTSAVIVMPETAPIVKVQNTRALGAEVILAGSNYQEAFEAAQGIAREKGRIYIPAFEDPFVISGQGTTALEILEQLPDPDYVVTSIGGGGLAAGMSVVFQTLNPSVRLIGCQATGAPSMLRALKEGHAVALDQVNTFADGIAVGKASDTMRKLLENKFYRVLEADDESIAAAVLTLLEKAKVLIEGSGALQLAVLDQIRDEIAGKKVVIVLSGGNIDVNVLARIIDRGLVRAGRRLRLNVVVSDRPGSLAKLTGLIAKLGANILQAIHDRNEPSTEIDQTEIALTIETRGPEHSTQVIESLRKEVVKIELGK